VRVWNSAGSGKGQWQVHVSTPVTLYFCVCLLVGRFGWLSILLIVLEFQMKIIAHLTEFCSILYTACLSLSASCQVTTVYKVSVYTTLLYFFKIHLIFPCFLIKVCNTFNFIHSFTPIIMSYSNKGGRCESYQIRADFSAFHFHLLSLTNVNLVECLE
jgi:hypothetical protein